MGPESVQITCPSCEFSRSVPLTRLPSAPVNVTCPQCRHAFTFNTHLGMTLVPPEPASEPTDKTPSEPNQEMNPHLPAEAAIGEAPQIPQKYRDFADDYNSGIDRAALCRKYEIPNEKFQAYLEFLRRKGLFLADLPQPVAVQPVPSSGDSETPQGKDVPSWKKSGLFEPIGNREGALKLVRDAAKAFYFLAGLQMLIGLFLMPELVTDGIAFAILAFLLQKFSSRVAASLLLLISSISLVVTVMNLAGISSHGGRNIWLAVIVVIVSARATEATFRLHGQYNSEASIS